MSAWLWEQARMFPGAPWYAHRALASQTYVLLLWRASLSGLMGTLLLLAFPASAREPISDHTGCSESGSWTRWKLFGFLHLASGSNFSSLLKTTSNSGRLWAEK